MPHIQNGDKYHSCHPQRMTEEATDQPLAPVVATDADSLADNIVSKSNSLVRASYRLTLQEQRLILLSISKLDSRRSHISPRNDQARVRITAAEFAETFGIDRKKAYEELKEATDQLFERKIIEIDGKKTDKLRWVQRVTYHDGEGWAEVQLSQDVLPMLTLLREKFTSYRVKRVAGLRSAYSYRLFELLSQFSATGLLRIDLAELITVMQLPYDRYIDIARRVIEPSVKELRAKSNLEIEWRPIKEGRAVKSLEFKFNEAAQGKLDLSAPAGQREIESTPEAQDLARAMSAFESLPPADRSRTLERFAETLKGPLKKTYDTQGLGSPIIRGSLAGWLARGG